MKADPTFDAIQRAAQQMALHTLHTLHLRIKPGGNRLHVQSEHKQRHESETADKSTLCSLRIKNGSLKLLTQRNLLVFSHFITDSIVWRKLRKLRFSMMMFCTLDDGRQLQMHQFESSGSILFTKTTVLVYFYLSAILELQEVTAVTNPSFTAANICDNTFQLWGQRSADTGAADASKPPPRTFSRSEGLNDRPSAARTFHAESEPSSQRV